MRGGSAAPFSTILSDSAGRFLFDHLPAGTYLVGARRPGYLPGRFGTARSGSPIVLEEGGRFVAEVRLRRAASISGEVLDENGVGLLGITVFAFRDGELPLRITGSAMTDDRGAFRISGLEPGRYYVRTGARELEDHRGLLPTFLGQTAAAAEARTVHVEASGEAGGLTIQPLTGKLARVSGRILGGVAGSVGLYSDSDRHEIMPAADGSFTIDQVAPGEYELLAFGPGGSAYRRFRVGEEAIRIAAELGPQPLVSVRIERPPEAAGRDARAVVLLKRQGQSREFPMISVTPGTPASVLPGEYTAKAQAPPEYYIESVLASNGRGPEFTAFPGQAIEIVVVLSAKPARISGKVALAGGTPALAAPVYLYPADPDLRSRAGEYRLVRTGEDGRFTFPGLPPGQYYVFSSLGVDDPERADPRGFPARSVTTTEGEEVSVELELRTE